MEIFDLNNQNSLNLPPGVSILSLFAKPTDKPRKIEPWMDLETVVDIVTDRMIEVVKKDLAKPIEPREIEEYEPA
ncbi:MAG: hypothetical protein IT270_01240 [Saprospiraceae bacterium]|nr:hypothetical protein [Saprospiraceae bacterium]